MDYAFQSIPLPEADASVARIITASFARRTSFSRIIIIIKPVLHLFQQQQIPRSLLRQTNQILIDTSRPSALTRNTLRIFFFFFWKRRFHQTEKRARGSDVFPFCVCVCFGLIM